LKNYQHNRANIPEPYSEVIDALIEQRHKLKMSQEELAHKIGCTKSLIHKWEQYKRIPSGFMFVCWLDALGLTIKIYKKKAQRQNRQA